MKEFNIRYAIYAEAKFLGLGIMIDNNCPVTIESKRFIIDFKFIFIKVWFEICKIRK